MKRLSLSDWNATPVFRIELEEFLKTHTGRALIEVLESISPDVPRGVCFPNPHDAHIEHGRESGWRDCRGWIIRLSNEITAQQAEEPKRDYAPENNNDE
jgi:hypothetical protein